MSATAIATNGRLHDGFDPRYPGYSRTTTCILAKGPVDTLWEDEFLNDFTEAIVAEARMRADPLEPAVTVKMTPSSVLGRCFICVRMAIRWRWDELQAIVAAVQKKMGMAFTLELF